MPELPEVVTVKNFLKTAVEGRKIERVQVNYSKMMSTLLKNSLTGQYILNISSKGKYIIFHLDDFDLISHLRMEGKYYIPKTEKINKHDHVIFYFKDFQLRYNDTRKFGTFDLKYKKDTYTTKPLSLLADEPFDIDPNTFYQAIHKSSRKIKTILLDQTIISGIGNIYANEILFLSKINPNRLGNQIKKGESSKLIKHSIKVLNEAIMQGGTTLHTFTNNGEVGYFAQSLLVHGKALKPCPICGTKIIKEKINGRMSYYCPVCQKE
jgi:formamidopyrimidine-DNA glycosylase